MEDVHGRRVVAVEGLVMRLDDDFDIETAKWLVKCTVGFFAYLAIVTVLVFSTFLFGRAVFNAFDYAYVKMDSFKERMLEGR